MEQVDSSVVGKDDPSCEAIKQLAIGDIRPQEVGVTEVEIPQVVAAPISTDAPDAEQQQTPTATSVCGSAMPESGSAVPESGSAVLTQSVAADSTPACGQDL